MRHMRTRARAEAAHAVDASAWRPSTVIAAILVVGALYLARQVLIPLSLAVLLSFLLSPLVRRLRSWGLPHVPAVMVVVVLGLAGFLTVGWLVAVQTRGLVNDLPSYRENIVERIRNVRATLGAPFGQARETIREIRKEIAATPSTQAAAADGHTSTVPSHPAAPTGGWSDAVVPYAWRHLLNGDWPESPVEDLHAPTTQSEPLPVRIEPSESNTLQLLGTILGPLLWPLTSVGIATVFVIFMLVQGAELRDRLICLIGRGHLNVTTEALQDAAGRVTRYLVVQVLVNTLHGVVIATGLTLIGFPHALLWGLIAGMLRFVPFLGTWTAAAVPILLSLAVFDDWLRPALVAALFLCVDLASVNIVEPWLYGARTGVAPLALLVSAVFWTWLWGGVGLFLATPLTVCLVVIGRYVPHLQLLSMLLGDQPALPPHMRLYQRLVALDEPGATSLVREARREMSLIETYDALLLPALREAEQDRSRRVLDGQPALFIGNVVRGLLAELGADTASGAPDRLTTRRAAGQHDTDVLCIPARDPLDELSAHMLAQVLADAGLAARVSPAALLAAELIALVRNGAIPVVCICALPPSSPARIRYLCKRLRRSAARSTLIVALWSEPQAKEPESADAPDDAGIAGVHTLSEACEVICAQLRSPAEPAAVTTELVRAAGAARG